MEIQVLIKGSKKEIERCFSYKIDKMFFYEKFEKKLSNSMGVELRIINAEIQSGLCINDSTYYSLTFSYRGNGKKTITKKP